MDSQSDLMIREYSYVGFGGPFFEDFKLMYEYLNVTEMYSLEVDEVIHQRQKFNLPYNCINLFNSPKTSSDFITEYDEIMVIRMQLFG